MIRKLIKTINEAVREEADAFERLLLKGMLVVSIVMLTMTVFLGVSAFR